MRICITATGQDIDAIIDQLFGRAHFFLFVDSETLNIDAVRNCPGTHGAGIRAAQIVVEKGASVVITGQVSRNAYQALAAAGVAIYVGVTGPAREGLQAYQAGCLSRAEAPTRGEHPWSMRCRTTGGAGDSQPVCAIQAKKTPHADSHGLLDRTVLRIRSVHQVRPTKVPGSDAVSNVKPPSELDLSSERPTSAFS
ncbi:NifB/NifX family molybdenum-iron cluster-binding protein [Candidatus Bipolaricaulota bacterium]